MPNAFVLMTAMPPTKGHLELIQFAGHLVAANDGWTTVVVCTQPGEPYTTERVDALRRSVRRTVMDVSVVQKHVELPQEPEQDPGFWDMWASFLTEYGFEPGDYVVASEPYGQRLAEEVGGVFMPYDLDRFIRPARATKVRQSPREYFSDILPAFQKELRKTVTIYGAESCGKTTLTKELANNMDPAWGLPEWARPYLEAVGAELTRDKMVAIWKGQLALQKMGQNLIDRPFVFQDTDLFSTVGYWRMKEDQFGPVPEELIDDAIYNRSDLYLVTPSNIPFEADPLRYGGDVREGSDPFWLSILVEFNLNYHVLKSTSISNRWGESIDFCRRMFDREADLHYDRVTKATLATAGK